MRLAGRAIVPLHYGFPVADRDAFQDAERENGNGGRSVDSAASCSCYGQCLCLCYCLCLWWAELQVSGKGRRMEERKEGWVEPFFWAGYSPFSASCVSASCGPSAPPGPPPLRRPLPHLPLPLHLHPCLNHWLRSETVGRMKERETMKE